MQPRNCLARPQACGISVAKFLGYFAQQRVIIGRLVVRDGAPVHRLRGEMRLLIRGDYIGIPSLSVGILLVYECDSPQTVRQPGHKVVVRQIALESCAFVAIAVEENYSRSPYCTKAVEPSWMFLDVGLYGQEVFGDKPGRLLIFIRLGIQPSTCASSRGCTEVQQYRARLFFG